MPTPKQLCASIARGEFDAVFTRLYGQDSARQPARYTDALSQFEALYGGGREVAIYSAPGRTEIGGNHTDHNNGRVMAAAVNLDIIAIVAKNEGCIAHVTSKGFRRADTVDLADLKPVASEMGYSASLVRGVAAGIVQRGGKIGGFDAYTTNDVLRGSGLSSSAAFEVCMAAVLNGEYNEGRFSAIELGQIGQYAENVFFGKPSGLMDQTASAVGSAITIDFKDPENPVVQNLPLNLADFGHKLVITDTKGNHANLTDEYAAVREEMESVAAQFGKKVLREVDPAAFFEAVPRLRGKVGDRALLRAIHFYMENERVLRLAAEIEAGDFDAFKATIIANGHSSFEYNQNAYSLKNPQEQGVALGLAVSQHVLDGRGAWRLQGGGFAGTIQAFVPDALLEEYCTALRGVFGEDACYVLDIRGDGAVPVRP